MNPITFPGLGLSFQIERVAFSIFGKDIYWYGVLIATGFLMAVGLICCVAKMLGENEEHVLDMLYIAVPSGIISARIYYVVFYLDLYLNADGSMNWGRAIAIWDGGIAVYGSIIGGMLASILFCKLKKYEFLSFADCCMPGMLVGQIVGRWGNFVNQEAFGGETTLPWRMGLTLSNGSYVEVHPTFLYESLWNLVGLAILLIVAWKFRKFHGQVFFTYLFWYGLGRFWIEGLRTDSLYLFHTGIRVSQMVALVSVAVAVCVFAVHARQKKE